MSWDAILGLIRLGLLTIKTDTFLRGTARHYKRYYTMLFCNNTHLYDRLLFV